MKNILLFLTIISFCITTVNAQVKIKVKDNFKENTCNNIDSAIIVLNQLLPQQYKKHNRGWIFADKYGLKHKRGNIIAYKNITEVKAGTGAHWQILLVSKITKGKALICFNDKEMAEQAHSALMCLINNAQNK